jgi:acetyl/propionyl-CoA carboxylase alpha subunit
VYAGYTIPRFYDTLMAKLIVWAPDREAAIARMRRALREYRVAGVRTTIPLLERVVADRDFAEGRLSTAFLDRLIERDRPEAAGQRRTVAVIAAALAAYERADREAPPPAPAAASAWTRMGRPGWGRR